MLIDDNGQLIRCPVSGIRIMGRNTQGVKIFNIDEKYSVVSVEEPFEVGIDPYNKLIDTNSEDNRKKIEK